MASTETLPRFFKVFISHFSSDSMLIPISYYDELPRHLPKTAILQGTGGCVWKVAMTLKLEEEEVYFEQGWPKFVKDNALVDGDFMTFVYNGDNIFEVSIYGLDGCKETRAVAEVEDDQEEDSICALSSDDTTDTSAESEKAKTVQRNNDKGKAKVEAVDDSDDEEDSVYSLSNSKDTDKDTSSESEMANAVPRSENKGKSKEEEVKEESDDEEDNEHSLNSEDTVSESKMDKKTKKKGKKKKKVESSDSDYAEEFGRLEMEEDSSSDSSYAPDSEDTATHAKRKVTSPKKKGGSQGKSKVIKDVVEVGDSSCAVERVPKRREKVKSIIENPEVYLDDPTNIYFETGVKNRKYELLVHAQLVKDYCLRFKDYIYYIDPKGKLEAKTARWKDQRVCIKKWIRICNRNKLKKEDRVVCELLRNKDLVYAVKIHIVRAKYLV